MLYKKKCDDCSLRARYDANDKILNEIRKILRTPERKDIIHHARSVMKKLDSYENSKS